MAKKKEEIITIHNIKGTNHRQIHVDGASAGITPSGYINVNFYSERGVIPKSTSFKIKEDGTLGSVVGHSEESKDGIVREFDFGIFVDINTCKSLRQLLDQKIKEYYQYTPEKQ
jgi:hypothetical protein